MPRKISDVLGVPQEVLSDQGVFNGFVDVDSKFYVDPHLLQSASICELQASYKTFMKHFEEVSHLLNASKYPEDRFFRKAVERLTFRESPFIALGYSVGHAAGSGIGSGLATKLAQTASEIAAAGITDPVIFELVGLIEDKIGADRISDMTIRIILPDLLNFSQHVAKDLDIRTRNIKYQGQSLDIPSDSVEGKPIILIPSEILRHLPVAYDWDDIDYVCTQNEELRNRVNQIIGYTWKDATATHRVSKKELRSVLLSNPELLRDLINQYKSKPAGKYDFRKDPAGELIWYEIAQDYAKKYHLALFAEQGVSADNILEIVITICNHFKSLVESNGLCIFFYDELGNLRHERFAQLLFFGIADAYCAANNLDLSREPNAGRGPVDFKISRGYSARVNVEVKYTSNTKLYKGYTNQLPIYNEAERTTHSIYLVIRTTESTTTIKSLKELHEARLAEGKRVPDIILVDGRTKPSASNS